MENIFGKPDKGIHSYRFMGIAIVDLLLTLLLCVILYLTIGMPLSVSLTLLLIIAFILHYLFRVQTSSMTYLGVKFR